MQVAPNAAVTPLRVTVHSPGSKLRPDAMADWPGGPDDCSNDTDGPACATAAGTASASSVHAIVTSVTARVGRAPPVLT